MAAMPKVVRTCRFDRRDEHRVDRDEWMIAGTGEGDRQVMRAAGGVRRVQDLAGMD
jgi:hypothetical protein